jgi:hypothetical protein
VKRRGAKANAKETINKHEVRRKKKHLLLRNAATSWVVASPSLQHRELLHRHCHSITSYSIAIAAASRAIALPSLQHSIANYCVTASHVLALPSLQRCITTVVASCSATTLPLLQRHHRCSARTFAQRLTFDLQRLSTFNLQRLSIFVQCRTTSVTVHRLLSTDIFFLILFLFSSDWHPASYGTTSCILRSCVLQSCILQSCVL